MAVDQKSSLSSIATDPLRNFKFAVVIQPPTGTAINLGFMTVSGLGLNIDVIPYREGGMNVTTQKMPGQADFNPITLTRGVTLGTTQLQIDWIKELFAVVQGTGTAAPGSDFRSTMFIYVLDHPDTGPSAPYKAGFKVYNCWPSSVAYSDLDAGANQLLISQMTLAHEGFDPQIAGGAGTAEIAGW